MDFEESLGLDLASTRRFKSQEDKNNDTKIF